MPNRPLLIMLTTIAAVSLTAAPALAKGVKSVTACGPSECASTGGHDVDEAEILGGGSATTPPDKAEGWYRVELDMLGGPALKLRVLPESGYLYSRDRLGGSLWTSMSPAQQAFYRRLTVGLNPLPAAKLKGLENPQLPAANAAPPAPAASEDDGSSPLPWVLGATALAALLVAAFVRRARRRSAPPATA